MNDELQNEVVKLISGILETTSKAGDFLASEMPEYLSQLILWYGFYNLILFIVGLLLLVTFIVIDFKYGKYMYRSDECTGDDFWLGYVCLGSVLRTVIYVPISITLLNLTWLQIYIAPKVWLVEYVATISNLK
jgi:hypothetical protein